MPHISLQTTIVRANRNILRLLTFYRASLSSPPTLRYYVAELLLIRLFSIFEQSVENIALKLCAGAYYLNGSKPNILFTSKSIVDASNKIHSHGRGAKSLFHTKWTTLNDITKNLKFSMPLHESFISNFMIHNAIVDEMRLLRNHAAHGSESTRAKYRNIVQSTYGAKSRVKLGVFLTSTTRVQTPKIEEYIKSAPIVLHDLACG